MLLLVLGFWWFFFAGLATNEWEATRTRTEQEQKKQEM
jgi:hypothetical protein